MVRYYPNLFLDVGFSMQPSHQIKYPIGEDGVFNLVTHVSRTWNSVLKGLEQIDAVFDELIIDEEQ